MFSFKDADLLDGLRNGDPIQFLQMSKAEKLVHPRLFKDIFCPFRQCFQLLAQCLFLLIVVLPIGEKLLLAQQLITVVLVDVLLQPLYPLQRGLQPCLTIVAR